MKRLKSTWVYISSVILVGCTTGHLEYITPEGIKKIACETEYTWQPSVDKYAVEYIVSYCAIRAVEEGNTLLNAGLLEIDRSLPAAPAGVFWSHELAKSMYQRGQLTDKEYGYLIAALDLGHVSREK